MTIQNKTAPGMYPLIEEVTGALGSALVAIRSRSAPPAEPLHPLLQAQAGRAESPGWFLIQALEFDPEPLTAPGLRQRDVYAAEGVVQALLELMASARWLDRIAPGSYALTPVGRDLLDRSLARTRGYLTQLTLPPLAQQERLSQLFGALIQVALERPAPPGVWCLTHSRNRAPAQDAPAIQRIRQYLDDFNAFRDDAHMAAWQPYDLHGGAWEAFSLIWTGEARTVAQIAEQLAHRGYSRADYGRFVEDLARSGWVAASGETLHITEAGQKARADAEQRTDEYFYAPWASLGEQDITQLRALLEELRDACATHVAAQ